MKKTKLLSIAMSVFMILSLFTGCDEKNNENSMEDLTVVTTKAPETPEEFHNAMISNSFVQIGNTYRLEKKLAQMSRGEKTTIAYIGGSITEGISAGANDCYAILSYNYLSNTYGTGDNVQYINAGLSGTPSVLGTLRVERDILSKDADIVFIEFAVNDGQDQVHKESYESLIRTILSWENEPAIILLFTVLENGYSAQAHMKQLGEYYELPMISVADALTPEFDAGRMVWADYSDDSSHPHVDGHKLVSEFIENYFSILNSRFFVDSEYVMKPAALFGFSYQDSILIDKTYDNSFEDFQIKQVGSFNSNSAGTRLFSNGWANDKLGSNESMKFTVTANCVTLIYKRNNDANYGKVDIYVDGEKRTTIDSNDKDGWGDPFTRQISKRSGVKTMEIEIRMSEGSEDKDFSILGIAYSQNESY